MAEVLENLSNALAATVETASTGVVRVEARNRLPATGIVWTAEGVIVTAHHVVERDDNIQVGLPDGSTAPASLAGRDPTTDLAVLRVQSAGLKPLPRAAAGNLRVGHLALALGRPEQSILATLGIVSSLGEAWRTPAGGQVDQYVQTDVVMYPGFSGGPLVNVAGQLAGLNTSALLRGVSLAIPTATIARVADMLLAHGRVRRGYLGIGAQPVALPAALAAKISQDVGLLIMSVEPGSPAEASGLLLGDTLVAIEGQPVRHLDDLLAQLSSDRIGSAVSARVIRGGQAQEVKVTIGERA